VQWDREPELDRAGNVIGFKDTMKVTPSRLLTREQAAQVKSVTTKSGGLKFEVNDRLAALAQLAKVLALTPDRMPPGSNTQVNVGQVNVAAPDNALEMMRRLAFAIAKANQANLLKDGARAEAEATSHAAIEAPKGSSRLEVVADPPK
jgi:hypothetical protein